MTTTQQANLEPQTLADLLDEFHRLGCVLIPNVLTADEVARLRAKTDDYEATTDRNSKHYTFAANAFVLRYCHELDPLFAAMTTHPTILQVAQAVLGANAKFNAMNVIRNGPGQAIAHWHVDDVLEFSLPPEIPRFDARMRMPIFWMTVQVALSDIDRVEHGPTQFVPTSHYSGRKPSQEPEFEGYGPQSVFCRAGDIYLTNHQCWHRGAPNLSDRVRYIMQIQYAQGWADRRFRGVA
ncbi:MAG TPA: phytanoyl-CoA dioxygenase family protein [Caldilineaceae bacterium]|nr:phytanoyl-CoA dioxygenase family protein [Caldilineaceae bacterium]